MHIHRMILESINEGVEAIEQLAKPQNVTFIEEAARIMVEAFQLNKKILIAGNGGSLCDASHFAEELTGFFRQKRPALAAISLSDPAHITCVGNDIGFEHVFSRGVEALGNSGDIFVGISTSGNSPNIIRAFSTAKNRGLKTIAFLGKEGGQLRGVADLELIIDNFENSDRIQEAHMTAIHTIIHIIEAELFGSCDSGIVEEFLETMAPRADG